MTTMLLAKVNCLFLAILLSFPPTSGLNQLDLLHGEVGDVQDDQEEGGVLLFHLQDHGGQDGREGELQDGVGEGGSERVLQFDPLDEDGGGQGGGGGGGVVQLGPPAHTEDGGGQGGGGGEGVVQLAPPGRGGGVGQDCGGPARQWGVWGGRWKSLSSKSVSP